jgi:hypothetical protein
MLPQRLITDRCGAFLLAASIPLSSAPTAALPGMRREERAKAPQIVVKDDLVAIALSATALGAEVIGRG